MALSKSNQAVMWLEDDPSRTQAEAAKLFDVARSTVARAVSKRSNRDACPCCGQSIREGRQPGRKTSTSSSQ